MMGELDTVTIEDVRRSLDRARSSLAAAAEEVVWQVENKTWEVAGYADWDEMREAEYGGAAFMVPRTVRPELVARLRDAGLTQQEIADTAGVGQSTVDRDLTQTGNADEPSTEEEEVGVPRAYAWSRKVESISYRVPIEDLTDDEVAHLHGAATFLRNLCRGEQVRRGKA